MMELYLQQLHHSPKSAALSVKAWNALMENSSPDSSNNSNNSNNSSVWR
jgi:hypothetical protein